MSTVYKIRNKNNHNEFLNGTPSNHKFCSVGRSFDSEKAIKTFITIMLKHQKYREKVDTNVWEIVEYTITETQRYEVADMVSTDLLIHLMTQK